MRVLVVGGGGREHALAWALSRSEGVDRLFAAPANAGLAEIAAPVEIPAGDVAELVNFAESQVIDLTVVGPEAPLVAGLADELRAREMAVFGPGRAGARLEGSKVWAREVCDRHGIPAPRSRRFEEVEAALAYLDEIPGPPYVVKADGLAAGKGVTVAADWVEAEDALRACLVRNAFGDAGHTVLVEEYLEGSEVSAMAITDGRVVVPLALAQDYKRAEEGDHGPNTGGMGSYSPLPFVGQDAESLIRTTILERTVHALAEEGIPYAGVLYAGLMLTVDGPKVLEFNCRFGDPETQVVIPRLNADLAEVLAACAAGRLNDDRMAWSEQTCAGVVLASRGYPSPSEVGLPISGLEEAGGLEEVHVFHAGTQQRDGRVVTAGGRVLTVTALGSDLREARARAYEACSLIEFDGMRYRRDIAAPTMAGRT